MSIFVRVCACLSQSLGDFGDEEYHKMVCIEPGIVSKFHRWAKAEKKKKKMERTKT